MSRTFVFDYTAKTAAFPHQPEAIAYIQQSTNSALFDEQGLGKTKVVIAALSNNMRDGVINGAIVVCRKHLIPTWVDEISRHTHLTSISLVGSSNEKGMQYMGYAQFYLLNYEGVIAERERLAMLLRTRHMALVLDEAHRVKNPAAESTRAVMSLRDLAAKRVIVTGTPLANAPEDLWSQFYFLDGGDLLGTDYRAFKAQYSSHSRAALTGEETERLSLLRSLVMSHSMRRRKNDVLDLPGKSFERCDVVLQGRQATLYIDMREDLRVEVTNMTGERVIEHAEMILKRLLRLVQLASNPRLIDASYKETPAKFLALDHLVSTITDAGEKAIIWTSFVKNARELSHRYQQLGVGLLVGSTRIDDRTRIVNDFQNQRLPRLIVANPAAAREGLTLTAANHAIYVDRSFNLVDYLQSQDRIHRISQGRDCVVTQLVAQDTVDEYVDDILVQKSCIAQYVEGDTSTLAQEASLTREEILQILGGEHGRKRRI
jgi:SWI/SNF-related matrix-associated actin-dependent regulator 1 of chromatin subfamily A